MLMIAPGNAKNLYAERPFLRYLILKIFAKLRAMREDNTFGPGTQSLLGVLVSYNPLPRKLAPKIYFLAIN
jgi:hypothetical protein